MYTTYKVQVLVDVAFELTSNPQTIVKPNNRSLFRELFANTKVPEIFRNLTNHISIFVNKL